MLAITSNGVDLVMCAIRALTLMVCLLRNEMRYRRTRTTTRTLMGKAMVDWSYSSALVRHMDKEGR